MMNTFLTSNEAKWRLARTFVQAILAAIIAYLPDLLGLTSLSPNAIQVLIPVIMMILSPIMAYFGENAKKQEEEEDV